MMETKRLLRVKEAAKYLAVSDRTIWSLTKDGKLPAVKFNRNVRYSIDDLQKFIDNARGGVL